jgi:uncharacterized zinc-type alcohol dehydrogenase-like protein
MKSAIAALADCASLHPPYIPSNFTGRAFSMTRVRAFAADGPKAPFKPFTYELPELGGDEIDVDVEYCGLCHSDLSMWGNDWRITKYPFVGGHEVVGRVRAKGANVPDLKIGQKVGIGWYAKSNMSSAQSIAGDHHLSPGNEGVIVGRHGGFADITRCQWIWAAPLPDDLDITTAGPLFCGGITVFSPIASFGVKPTDKVAVVGIGGLGHLATQFLNKWGCEVTAFTSSPDKAEEAKRFGAHKTLDSRNPSSWKAAAGRFDFILVTVNVPLDWPRMMATLAPKGRLHFVGAVEEPVGMPVSAMMGGQKSMSASPMGSPATVMKMLDFCTRHGIHPLTERFPMSRINEAMAHLEAGKARYRIVLENDFAS